MAQRQLANLAGEFMAGQRQQVSAASTTHADAQFESDKIEGIPHVLCGHRERHKRRRTIREQAKLVRIELGCLRARKGRCARCKSIDAESDLCASGDGTTQRANAEPPLTTTM